MRRVPWIALGVLVSGLLGGVLVHLHLRGVLGLPPCPFKQITGLPCASCGLTRSVMALLQGNLGDAFYWHPVGALGLLLLPMVVVWDGWRAFRGSPYPGLPDQDWARWAVMGILAGTWWLQIARGI